MSEYTAKPFIDEKGNLHIPFDSDPRFHHWNGGQSIIATLNEMSAPVEAFQHYLLPDEYPRFIAAREETKQRSQAA